MKQALILIAVSLLSLPTFAQFIYNIKADSVRIHNDSCNAELQLKNSTRNVPGFLFNKGDGRTEFRKGLIQLNDSLYLIGADTLKITNSANSWIFRNGLKKSANIIEWGNDTLNAYGPASLNRPTVFNQNFQPFQWITYSKQFHVTNFPTGYYNQNLALSSYIPFRVSHTSQGFMYLDGDFRNNNWNGPLFGILFGNRNPAAKTFSYFNQQVTGNMILVNINKADLTSDIPAFDFHLAGDTLSGSRAVTIIGAGNTRYGMYKFPTLMAHYRFMIGGGGSFNEGTNYPYTRFFANANNQPFVWKNLPLDNSTTGDTVLSIDFDGNVRRKIINASATSSPKAFQTLTDAATVAWDYANGYNAKVTINGNRTLSITNVQDGDTGTLLITAAVAGATITWPGGSYQLKADITDGSSAVTTDNTKVGKYNGADVTGQWLCRFAYDGTAFYWTIKKVATMN